MEFDFKEWKKLPETEECLAHLNEHIKYLMFDLKMGGKEKYDLNSGRIDGFQEAVDIIKDLGEEE